MTDTIDDVLKTQLLDEARRIGDQLLADAETDEHGMSWLTMGMDDKHDTVFEKSEGIYSGVSGISLFLLELSRRTGDNRYLDAAKQGMKWVVHRCREIPSDYYALFTGRLGVSTSLLRMYQVLGEKSYLDNALEIARSCKNGLESPRQVNDLLNGAAGALVGLLHLHAASNEEWLLDAANGYAKVLFENAFTGPKGLYWDRSPQTICGLCGYSHGAAGMGMAFLECGNYLKNPSYYTLAELAFLYENVHFNSETGNWPDLRNGVYSDEDREKHEKAFAEENWEFFTTGGDMNAWCHGAAGIGHSRLRALQLLNKDRYKKELDICLEKTKKTDLEGTVTARIKPTFTLCHGKGGNADIFLEMYRVYGDHQYLSMAAQIAKEGLELYNTEKIYLPGYRLETGKEDRSMFMGNAGIGYFYLRVLDPAGIPTMLSPYLDAQIDSTAQKALEKFPELSISPTGLYKRVIQKDFPRTIAAAEHFLPGQLEQFFNENQIDTESENHLTDQFLGFIEKEIAGLPQPQKERMEDVFTLEKDKQGLDRAITSHSLLSIKSQVLAEQAKPPMEMEEEEFLNVTLALDKDVMVTTTQWHWPLNQPEKWKESMALELDADDWPVLLKASALQVLEVELSPFSYTILAELYPENTVKQCIRGTVEAFDSLSPDEEKMLKEKILQQIRQFMQAAILLPKK